MLPRTRNAKSGTINIAYLVIGTGPPYLVLVPGWVSNIECFWEEPAFARFLTRLASFSRLILTSDADRSPRTAHTSGRPLNNRTAQLALRPGSVHRGANVVHALFEAGQVCDPVGETSTSFVEQDEA
jgi:hypothetical protein